MLYLLVGKNISCTPSQIINIAISSPRIGGWKNIVGYLAQQDSSYWSNVWIPPPKENFLLTVEITKRYARVYEFLNCLEVSGNPLLFFHWTDHLHNKQIVQPLLGMAEPK